MSDKSNKYFNIFIISIIIFYILSFAIVIGAIVFYVSYKNKDKADISLLYGMQDENGYNDNISNVFYIMNDGYNIPLDNSGYENPSAHQSSWKMSILVDSGTDTEYMIIYNEDHPEYGISTVERRKYEEYPTDPKITDMYR